jgi:hypothetical protein
MVVAWRVPNVGAAKPVFANGDGPAYGDDLLRYENDAGFPC